MGTHIDCVQTRSLTPKPLKTSCCHIGGVFGAINDPCRNKGGEGQAALEASSPLIGKRQARLFLEPEPNERNGLRKASMAGLEVHLGKEGPQIPGAAEAGRAAHGSAHSLERVEHG